MENTSPESTTSAIDRHPLTTTPDTTVHAAILLMVEARRSCILIVASREGNEYPLGMMTERDVVALTASRQDFHSLPISAIMTRQLVTVTETEAEDVMTLTRRLKEYNIRHLPVVNAQSKLVGLITPETIRSLLKPIDLFRLKQVQEVMSSQVLEVEPKASLLEIIQLMSQNRINCAVVTQAIGTEGIRTPMGIVTEHDVMQFHHRGLDLQKTMVRLVMSKPLTLMQPTDSMWMAHQMMQRLGVRRLVVSDAQGQLVGIITQSDMLTAIDPLEIYQTVSTLQQLVQEQTSRLSTINNQLHEEIDERRMLEKKLASSEGKVRAIFEAMTDIIITISLYEENLDEIQSIEVAPVNCWLADLHRTLVVEKTVSMIFQESRNWLQLLRRVVKMGITEQVDYYVEVEGKLCWFSANISPIDTQAVIWVARDISDRKAIETALQQRHNELTQILEKLQRAKEIAEAANLVSENLTIDLLEQIPADLPNLKHCLLELRKLTQFDATIPWNPSVPITKDFSPGDRQGMN